MRIALRGPFSVYSGYGADLVGLARALTLAGHDVVPVATSIMAGLPPEVAHLFAKEPKGNYDVGIMHQPPFDLRPPPEMRAQCDVLVGWTMWEQTLFTSEHQKGRGQGRNPWRKLDAILCYDHVSKEALDHYDPKVPKYVLQGGVNVDQWPYHEKRWDGPFRFVMLGQLNDRKNPWVAIDAYRELREDGELKEATLELKTTVPGVDPGIEELIPGVKVYLAVWSRARVQAFLRNAHVILAPSRGEGKNLPCLEVQLSGGVAAATGWGGPAMWQHPSYAPALNYKIVPIEPGNPSMHAAADKEHLKELMLKLYTDRAETKRMGELASRTIRNMCSWETVVENAELHFERAREIGYGKDS